MTSPALSAIMFHVHMALPRRGLPNARMLEYSYGMLLKQVRRKYMIEDFLYLSELYDIYGALLTEKQQSCLKLHLFEDFSLAEAGDALGITRQAVHDNIHRSNQAMAAYEEKLGLAARARNERKVLKEVYDAIQGLRMPGNAKDVDMALGKLRPLLGREQEEYP